MLYKNKSLKEFNTFGFDATAEHLLMYDTEEELVSFVLSSTNNAQYTPLKSIGCGSNLLFVSQFVRGTLLRSNIRGFEATLTPDGVLVRAGSGNIWDDFCRYAVENGWHGAENLSLIPGTVGAAAVQNIGAYGAEAADIVYEVEAINLENGEKRIFKADELNYGYRDSLFKHAANFAITYVTFALKREAPLNIGYGNLREQLADLQAPTIADVRQAVIDIRQAKLPDPAVRGNAGSFFKNPIIARSHYEQLLLEHHDLPHYDVDEQRVKVPAAALIDRCGLKGFVLNDAQIYERQPLVIVNNGSATAHDVSVLAAHTIQTVAQKFNITLECEVEFI